MARGKPPTATKSTRRRGSPANPPKAARSPVKRQRTKPIRPYGVATPYVSTTTGEDYFYDEAAEECHVFLKCSPILKLIPVPESASLFLRSAVRPFAREIKDVLVSQQHLLIILTLNENAIPAYHAFCTPGKHRIPNSDCFLQVSAVYMEEHLKAHYARTGEPYPGLEADSDDSDDYMLTASSSDEEERPTQPPWEKASLPHSSTTITELPASPDDTPAAATAPSQPVDTPESASQEPRPMDTASPPAPAAQPEPSVTTTAEQPSQRSAPRSTASKPRGRARFTKVDFAKLEVDVPPPPNLLTIIYRTTTAGHSLKTVNSLKLAKELTAKGGVPEAVRDIRNGGVAVDFLPDTPEAPLLAITELQLLPVTASLPQVPSSCSGVLTGVHWELTEEELIEETRTTPPTKILSAKRLAKPGQRSWVVKLTFQGLSLPERALLAGRSHKVKPYLDRPLQCLNCARYGHAARVCRSTARCWVCSQAHAAADCPNQATPLCSSCGGPHPADSRDCPTRGFQQKIVEVKTSTNSTFKAARKAVTTAARSYASALKGPPAPVVPADKPAPKPANKPAATPAFKPNVAHPRPASTPATAANLAALFQGLVALLTAAIQSNNFSDAIAKMGELFAAQAPGADPDLFRVLP